MLASDPMLRAGRRADGILRGALESLNDTPPPAGKADPSLDPIIDARNGAALGGADTGGADGGGTDGAAATPMAARGDVGEALRSIYQRTIAESVPDEMIDLLGRLD